MKTARFHNIMKKGSNIAREKEKPTMMVMMTKAPTYKCLVLLKLSSNEETDYIHIVSCIICKSDNGEIYNSEK